MRGKRVAVVGTGASAMQFVPAIAPEVDHLTIFQRSRHWVTPNPAYHRPVTDREKWLFANVPYYAGWYRFLQFWNSADRIYPAFRVDPEWPTPDISISRPNEKLRRIMTAHLERELADTPDLIDQVLPDYPPLGKRMLQDNGWFRTLQRDNVELVNERIARVTEHGVVTTSGDEHPADVLVLATGFHPNKFLWPMEITGRAASDSTTCGARIRAPTSASRCPGSRTSSASTARTRTRSWAAWSSCSSARSTTSSRASARCSRAAYASMECRRDVHDEYNERVDEEHEHMVWRHPKVHSYYNNVHGRVTTNAPWRLIDYWRMTRHPDLADFVLRTRGARMRLDGKTAIVTGGGSGFGRATAVRFGAEGANVVIAELDEEGGRETARLVAAAGSQAEVVVGDISTSAGAEQVGGRDPGPLRSDRHPGQQRRHLPERPRATPGTPPRRRGTASSRPT